MAEKLFQQDITGRAWVLDAECAKPKYDPDIWFPEGETRYEGQIKRAQAICLICPVLEACFLYACRYRLSQETIWGVWAGRPASWYDDRLKVARTLKLLEENERRKK